MDKNKLGCVYKIICLKNNKVYIGQTIDYKRRVWEHLYHLNLNKHKNHYLQEDYNKYQKDNFKFELIEDNLSLNKRRELETYWINYYGGIESDKVYNFQDNIAENIEMRQLVSDNQKGKIINPKSIEKMKKALKGRKLSEEHKQHIKDSCAKFIGDNNPAKKLEVRQKISEKTSGENNGMFGKRKYTSDFIQLLRNEYNICKSYNKLSTKYNINTTTINNLVKYGETYNPNSYLKKRKFNDYPEKE